MNTIPSFSNYVRTYRNRSGLTKTELAFLLGEASARTLSRHESGRSTPPIALFIAYEIALGAPIRETFPALYEEVDAAVRIRAAQLVDRMSDKAFDGKTKQKVEFLSQIIRSPEGSSAQQ